MKSNLSILLCLLVVPAIAGETVRLSVLDLSKATQGWGTTLANKSITGSALSIGGKHFDHGIGTHAEGAMALIIGGKAERFSAWVGVDDSAGRGRGTVVFKVLADGREVWSSGTMRGGEVARQVEVELAGVWLLSLVSEDAGDGFEFDHADWAEARLTMGSGRPAIVPVDKAPAIVESLRHPKQMWTLQSGTVQCLLRRTALGVDALYFGPAGAAPAEGSFELKPDFWLKIEGRVMSSLDLEVAGVAKTNTASGREGLEVTYRHPVLPLEIQAAYNAWGDSGVISRQMRLVNRGTNQLHIELAPSLSWRLPAGDYELTTLRGPWGAERQVFTEPLTGTEKRFESAHGRSTASQSPWFSLRHEGTGLRYLAQLAWSGNWDLLFNRTGTNGRPSASELQVELGIRFDRGGPALLPGGGSLELPMVAYTCTRGDLDDAANALHRFQRKFVVPSNPANEPPLVQFNSWYPFQGKMNLADMKRCVDVAVDLGAEVFVLDAGWYNKTDWFREAGDWQADLKAFPKGTAELAQYVHGKGLKFGIWVEIEVLGDLSGTFKQHPGWCLARDGKPFVTGGHYHLDFGKPEVRRWARGEMDRLMREHHLDWVKIDYNNSIGEALELADGTRPGTVLYRHVLGYYAWLDGLRAAYPHLVIENCSSGGLRFDLGLIGRTDTTWISDRTLPLPSVQLAYGATMEFTPQVCNHWMVGDCEDGTVMLDQPPGWWDFMLRVPMNGQFGISSKVFDWSGDLRRHAQANVALYKKIRKTVVSSDCYHLTPPPSPQNPEGWMALQYAQPDRQRSVLMAYRLKNSEARRVFKLRGLAPARTYQVTVDGIPGESLPGATLLEKGIEVRLPDEFRAAVIELEIKP